MATNSKRENTRHDDDHDGVGDKMLADVISTETPNNTI